MGFFSDLFDGVNEFLGDPLGGLVGSIVPGLLSSEGASDRNEQQLAMTREQMQWQERMSNTAHQREVADLNYFIENTIYDSMIFLNSDLIIHGYSFIKSLRKELFSDEQLMAVSGCVLQPEKNQCHWKMVYNCGCKEIRYVP